MCVKLTLAVLCVLVATAMGNLRDAQTQGFHTIKVPGGCYHFEGNVTCNTIPNFVTDKATVELYQKRNGKDTYIKKVNVEVKLGIAYNQFGTFEFDACIKDDHPEGDFEIYYLFENICTLDDQALAVPFLSRVYIVKGHFKGTQRIEAIEG